MLETISNTKILHESEFKNINDKWEKLSSNLLNARNTLVGGIGFGIGLWIGLMSLEIIWKTTAIFIIIPIGVALCIFVGSNIYVNKISQKIFVLEMTYQKHSLEFIKIKAWMMGRAMREDVTREQMIIIIQFNSLITQAIAYDVKISAYEQFKGVKPNQDDFRPFYNIAKNPSDEFKIFNIAEFPIIDSFIKSFEANEPKNSNRK